MEGKPVLKKISLIVPTIRHESIKEFIEAWQPLIDKYDISLYVIEDSDTKSDLGIEKHFYRKDFPDFIPTHTGGCRSYGFLQAYKDGADIMITLDDDCLPIGNPIAEYLRAFEEEYPVSDYFDVGHIFGLDEFMRGYPFKQRRFAKPLIQYGGWDNVPDLDAITQAKHEKNGSVENFRFDRKILAIPVGLGFTGCIMNVAFTREIVPMFYQLMMGMETLGYDRWDDIWSGLIVKKILDHLGSPVLINGRASVYHTRASNTESNLIKEHNGYSFNEVMWDNLKRIELLGNNPTDCYAELITQLESGWFGDRGYKVITGMSKWLQSV